MLDCGGAMSVLQVS